MERSSRSRMLLAEQMIEAAWSDPKVRSPVDPELVRVLAIRLIPYIELSDNLGELIRRHLKRLDHG